MKKNLTKNFSLVLASMLMIFAGGCSAKSDAVITQTNLEEFKSLSISAGASDIELLNSDHFALEVCKRTKDADPTLTLDDHTLKLDFHPQNSWMDFSNQKRYIKVYFPNSEKLENVSVETDSGNLSVSPIFVSKFDLNSKSGNSKISLKNPECINIKSLSGDLSLDQESSSPVDLNLNITSGSSNLTGDIWGNVNIGKKSGNLVMKGKFEGDTNINSVSGNTSLECKGLSSEYNFSLSSVSGKIAVTENGSPLVLPNMNSNTNPSNKSMVVNSTSGKISIDFKS